MFILLNRDFRHTNKTQKVGGDNVQISVNNLTSTYHVWSQDEVAVSVQYIQGNFDMERCLNEGCHHITHGVHHTWCILSITTGDKINTNTQAYFDGNLEVKLGNRVSR